MVLRHGQVDASEIEAIARAAEGGEVFHAYCLAWWHADGDYVARDPQAARRWFALLARLGGDKGTLEQLRYLRREGDSAGFDAVFAAGDWRLGALHRIRAEYLDERGAPATEVDAGLARAVGLGDLIAALKLHRRRHPGLARLGALPAELALLANMARQFWADPKADAILMRWEPDRPEDKTG